MALSGLVWTSFGLFLVALEAEFGWSRAGISGAFAAFALTNALSAPAVGWAMGRWNSRFLLAALAILLGGALCATATVQSLEAYWLTFGIAGGLGAQAFSSFAVFTILARRFRARPATAMSIADAGSGLAAFLGLPLMQVIIDDHGWRTAYLLLGVAAAVLGAMLHLKILDRVPRSVARTIEGAVPRSSAVIGLPFAAIALSYFCGSGAYQGLMTQQIALFSENGIDTDRAVWLAAWAGLVVFVWRIASGWLTDRWSLVGVMGIAAAATAVTFAALVAASTEHRSIGLQIYPLALGIAFGGMQVLLTASVLRVAAPRDYAMTLGLGRLASGLGMATGPLLAGFLHDLSGRYQAALAVLGALATIHFLAFAVAYGHRRRR